ncbi:cytochrome d ubiquinol oxidase subunit II [Paenibacillus turpanensis]|uniref:cytochrome d ubiquinol oxidase subunit II n=1 Tax=Paenibacillus turpanensis TaxID=2689078 RepID=UPI001409EF3D|nr:cytochrome d ubiquinol oxidase subunit II [Paenibacillus turpanensis]
MPLELVGIAVLWTFLYGYIIVASIDFGAGFFSSYSMLTGKKHIVHNIIERYLSPVWEITNVFLVFFVVGIIGFFPSIAYYYGTALLIPGSVAVILLAIRGSYYAFSTYGNREHKGYMLLYGASGLLIPASLSTILTISEGGYIQVAEDGRVTFLYERLFTSPYSWAVVLLSLVSVLYISAMFLTYYCSRAKDYRALELVRGYALAWSSPTIVCSLFVFLAINRHNPAHFQGMLDYGWMFVGSFLCFVGAAVLVYRRQRYGIAFLLVMLQYALAFFGYGAGHMPYLLYPYLSVHDHFTNATMASWLIAAFIAGLLLLIPSMLLLLRLFLFDAKYVEGKYPTKG